MNELSQLLPSKWTRSAFVRSISELRRALESLDKLSQSQRLDLLRLVSRRKADEAAQVEFQKLNGDQQRQVIERVGVIEKYLGGSITGPHAARELQISYSHFQALAYGWRDHHAVERLVPFARKQQRVSSTPEKREAIGRAIVAVETGKGPITLSSVATELASDLMKSGEAPIAASFIQKVFVETIPKIRDGGRLLPRWSGVSDGVAAFGDALVIDHVWTDRWAEASSANLGRVLWTTVFDARTRIVIGRSVSFGPATALATAAALVSAAETYTGGCSPSLPTHRGTRRPLMIGHLGTSQDWRSIWDATAEAGFVRALRRSSEVSHGAFATKTIGRTLGGVELLPRVPRDDAPPLEILDDIRPPDLQVVSMLMRSAVVAHNLKRKVIYPEAFKNPTGGDDLLARALDDLASRVRRLVAPETRHDNPS